MGQQQDKNLPAPKSQQSRPSRHGLVSVRR